MQKINSMKQKFSAKNCKQKIMIKEKLEKNSRKTIKSRMNSTIVIVSDCEVFERSLKAAHVSNQLGIRREF